MLAKLMKYELRSTGRLFLPLYAALIIVAVVNSLFIRLEVELPSVIGTFAAMMLIAAVCVITVVISLQRFYKNLLGDEGYLMHTLPVGADWLILSKLFVSSIWYIASGAAVLLAIILMNLRDMGFDEFLMMVSEGWRAMSLNPGTAALIIICVILSIFSGTLTLYACMALSMLVNRGRLLFSFGAYIAVTIALQITYGIGLWILSKLGALDAIHSFINGFAGNDGSSGFWMLLVLIIGVELFMCAVFYPVTRYMLKRKLNLE